MGKGGEARDKGMGGGEEEGEGEGIDDIDIVMGDASLFFGGGRGGVKKN